MLCHLKNSQILPLVSAFLTLKEEEMRSNEAYFRHGFIIIK